MLHSNESWSMSPWSLVLNNDTTITSLCCLKILLIKNKQYSISNIFGFIQYSKLPSVCFQLARWSRCRWRFERFYCDVTAWPGTSAACFLPCPTTRRPGACQTRAVPPRTGSGPRLTAARRRRGPSPSWRRFRSRSGKFSTTRRRTRIYLCLFPHRPEVYFTNLFKIKTH